MKKLIEVAIPLDVINKASAREKSIRHGHPSTLHLWWARRPLATARAVLFASLVDDPSEHPEKFPTPELVKAERKRLFDIIGNLVQWENSSDEKIFTQALDEIKKSCGKDLPAVFDPFAGGGTIPLEAQRLGLKAFASDLNPVAVMINKAMIELPAQFKNRPPVNPNADKNRIGGWIGAEGLAEDILYYGKLLKSKAFDKIGALYPKVYSDEHKAEFTVIAWLWARTVPCSNPACGHRMPLVHSFNLSTKQKVFVDPIVEGNHVRFEVRKGTDAPDGTVNRNGARCIFCGTNNLLSHVREQAKAGNMFAQMMAIVAEGKNGRIYLAPDETHKLIADVPKPDDYPEEEMNQDCPDLVSGRGYGFTHWHQLFTNRQLTALTTFSDLIYDVKEQIIDDGGSKDYADVIAVYLSFLIDKLADRGSSFCTWQSIGEKIRNVFGRQAIPMVWDFAETNPFSNSSGCFDNMLDWIIEVAGLIPTNLVDGVASHNAMKDFRLKESVMISTDPPYYDNISYAELSDFFYVWLRRPLKSIYLKIFGRMQTPKDEELIAAPYRHNGDSDKAKKYFEDGMFKVLQNIYAVAHDDFPTTIYYAYKQREAEDGASTGWETMLSAIIRAGFQITGTWPMRTERSARTLAIETNSLASSIVLVCRKRPLENKFMGKNEFLRTLKDELKSALTEMTQATIAPVDMAQAAIGPGIAVYSRYDKIADMTDTQITIRDALRIINAEVEDYLGGKLRRLDTGTQFCVKLFEQCGFNEISFGQANVLAQAKNISVDDLSNNGALISGKGIVRLRDRDEMNAIDKNKQLNRDWIKTLVDGNCAWLWVQTTVEVFKVNGIDGGAELLANFDGNLESLKNLAYMLYDICERHKWSAEGTGYNNLVMEWQDILSRRAEFVQTRSETTPVQGSLF
ncbi:MAG: DUF1156 domain-containing protein [Selenomonadaceae bacterium]|nr:DUF1156 domain-containing protein [Selenomonadaceae bacterium]